MINFGSKRTIILKWGDLQLTVEEQSYQFLVGIEYDSPDKHESGSLALSSDQWRTLVDLINQANASLKIAPLAKPLRFVAPKPGEGAP